MAMAYRDGPAAQDNHLEEVAGVGRTAEFEELRDHEELAAQFFAAFKEGDVDGLRELLATDVQLVSDTGGKAPAPRRVVVGAEKTARLLAATAPQLAQIGLVVEQREINRQPGAIARDRDGRVLQTVVLDIRDGLVHAIRSVANPDKLGHLGPVADPWALSEDYHAAQREAREQHRRG